MAHVEIPEEELQPLIQSMKRVFEPLVKAIPTLALIPTELKRIGDKLDDDMMSGMPERIESVTKKFTMDFGSKMLSIMEDGELKREKILEQQALKQEIRENKLQSLREKGLAVEIKENRVQFISEKDIVRKQKTNLKTQEILYKREKELQKLVEKGEKGSEDKIADLINKIVNLQKKEGEQSQELGGKKKEFKPGIMAKVGAVAEDILPEPIMGAFQEFGAGLADTGKTLLSFGKPFMALGKVADKQFGITEKLQKLNVARYALGLKQFALEKLEFAMDAMKNIKNIAFAAGIAAIISGIIIFKDTIMNVINSITGFFSGLKDSFLGKFMPSLGKKEPETPAQIEQSNVEKNVEAAGPLGALAEARETGTEKLARLKGEAGEMMKERLATNIVNMVSDNTSQTSVAVNPTVPKSTSADALALNPTG